MLDAPLSDPVPSTNECWDLVYDWTDNVGDSCVWYSQGNNCLYYGDEFPCTTDGNANLVCCTCGGGCTTPPLLGDYIEEIPGCSDSPAHWTDVDNDGCDWYAEDDNCQVFGSGYAGEDGKTANEACCFCGGGYDPNAPRIVPNITTPCTDVLDWTDSGGDPCSWYETDDHCFRFGTANAGPDGSTAVESCCVCGGGAAPLCSDKADWTDLEGDPCSWYEIEDRCLQFGIANAGIDGTTASESCCVCGGSAPVCNDNGRIRLEMAVFGICMVITVMFTATPTKERMELQPESPAVAVVAEKFNRILVLALLVGWMGHRMIALGTNWMADALRLEARTRWLVPLMAQPPTKPAVSAVVEVLVLPRLWRQPRQNPPKRRRRRKAGWVGSLEGLNPDDQKVGFELLVTYIRESVLSIS
ncbi:unknown protein [Seminavis robusta]|uniref:Uncharacterized protein n=1 Tax=Seminavis robusta TaxID=568900 RepID=A0A9N8E389_9STRA|nr:unknown protein [Seminavis robusta]|eukprot:Sro612_g175510.1 n/a (414) ;mRNA; r:49510-50751